MLVKIKNKIFYGWVIVGIVFLIMSIAYAIYFSFPLFYVAILDHFGWSRAETAIIFSIGSIVYGIGSAVAGASLDRFGPRKTYTAGAIIMVIGVIGCRWATEIWQFFFFWGGLTACGVCMVGFIPCNTLVANWFVKWRSTAVGIAQAGGRESFIMIPLVQFVIASLGWQNTFLVLAAIAGPAIVILAQFLKHSPLDMGLLPDGETVSEEKDESQPSRQERLIINKEWAATDWTVRRGLKQYRLWALFCASLTIGTGYSIVIVHQVAFMVDIGFTAMFASFLLLIFGITSMVGRLSAFIGDIAGREVAFTIGSGGVLVAFVMLVLSRDTSNAWMLYVYAVCFGLFSGLIGPILITTSADIFQGKHFGAILGFSNIGYGIGNAFGSWLGGYVFDTTNSYIIAFVVAIAAFILAATSIWIASPRKIRAVRDRLITQKDELLG